MVTGFVFFERFLVLGCCESSRIIFPNGAEDGSLPLRRYAASMAPKVSAAVNATSAKLP